MLHQYPRVVFARLLVSVLCFFTGRNDVLRPVFRYKAYDKNVPWTFLVFGDIYFADEADQMQTCHHVTAGTEQI